MYAICGNSDAAAQYGNKWSVVTDVWHPRKLKFESIGCCWEPGLAEAKLAKSVSHFLDNAGQQASDSGTRVGEIRISIFSSFDMTAHTAALFE